MKDQVRHIGEKSSKVLSDVSVSIGSFWLFLNLLIKGTTPLPDMQFPQNTSQGTVLYTRYYRGGVFWLDFCENAPEVAVFGHFGHLWTRLFNDLNLSQTYGFRRIVSDS